MRPKRIMACVLDDAVEAIRERAELIDLFTAEIVKFRDSAPGLDMNGDDAARYLATRLVEAMCY